MAACRGWKVLFGLIALNLAIIPLGAAQPARAQDSMRGTVCEAATDDDTISACTTAGIECAFVTTYGRTDEEKDRMYKNCIRKTVARYKHAADANGDAVRREYSDGPEDRAASKAAERKTVAASIPAKSQKELQLASQQRTDAVRQTCLTGRGTLNVVGATFVDGARFHVPSVWANDGQMVQPVADPDAVASGKCTVDFRQGGHSFVGRIAMGSLRPAGTASAHAATGGN
jgi:hypothetical protein